METADDILREMRTLGKLEEKSTDEVPRSLLALRLLAYANRLEAAKGVGEVRYQVQGLVKGEWTNLYHTQRTKRMAKAYAESSSAAAKDLGLNSQRRIVKIIRTEEVVWESE